MSELSCMNYSFLFLALVNNAYLHVDNLIFLTNKCHSLASILQIKEIHQNTWIQANCSSSKSEYFSLDQTVVTSIKYSAHISVKLRHGHACAFNG